MSDSRQRQALPDLVRRIREVDPECGIVLQGSVSKGTEREDSDIDLTVVTGEFESPPSTDWINETNRGRMIRVVHTPSAVNVDINWETERRLSRRFRAWGAEDWFIFSHGEILQDPLGRAQRCQEFGRAFFDSRPDLRAEWERQNEKVARKKRDPSYELEFPAWGDFMRNLRGRIEAVPIRADGSRVLLRRLRPDDRETLVRWWKREVAWMDWDAPWEEETGTEDEIRADWRGRLEKLAAAPSVCHPRLMISLADGTPIGTVNTHGFEDDEQAVAVGISICEERRWEGGLGTETFGLWVGHVFRTRGLGRIHCATWAGNERMIRLAKRWGFVEVRRWPDLRTVRGQKFDAVRFALERGEFERRVLPEV